MVPISGLDREGESAVTDLLPARGERDEPRRRANTRTRLLEASVQVFAEKGLDGATIDDLVSAAGFTRGAFYSSFSSKEDLFGAAFSLATDQIIRIITDSVAAARADLPTCAAGEEAGEDGAADARLMVEVFEAVRPFGRQWCLLHSEAVTRSLRSDEARQQLSAERARLRDVIAATLAQGPLHPPAEGALTASGPIALTDLAQLLVSIFIDLMVREQLEDIEVSVLAPPMILRTIRAFTEPAAD